MKYVRPTLASQYRYSFQKIRHVSIGIYFCSITCMTSLTNTTRLYLDLNLVDVLAHLSFTLEETLKNLYSLLIRPLI